jgi:hypothetical protein
MRDEEPSEYAEHRKVVDLGWAKTMDLTYSKPNGWHVACEPIAGKHDQEITDAEVPGGHSRA